MKKLTYTGIALGMFLGLVGCSNASTDNVSEMELVTEITEPVSIEFWHSMSGALGDTLNSLVEDFNNSNDKGITVTATYQGGYEDLKSKVVGAIKAGNNPSIVQGTVNGIMDFTQSGMVQPLNEYIFHEEVGIKDFDDIYEVYRTENSSYDEEGTFYSLPISKSTDLLFYNKTFFEEHGLTVPTTWEEVVEVSKQITGITGKPSFSIDNTANYLINYLFQSGADYTNRNGEVLFNNESSVEALTMLKENMDKGYWRLAGEDLYSSAPFLSGNVVMYLGSSAGESFLNDDNFVWDATSYPQVDPNAPKYIQQGNNVAVLNQNKSSEEVYASYEFIKYLCSHEANLTWATNTAYSPLRDSVATSEEYQEFVAQTNKNSRPSAIESAKNGFVEDIFATDTLTSNIVRNEVGVMIETIVLGGADIQETLNTYEQRLK